MGSGSRNTSATRTVIPEAGAAGGGGESGINCDLKGTLHLKGGGALPNGQLLQLAASDEQLLIAGDADAWPVTMNQLARRLVGCVERGMTYSVERLDRTSARIKLS